MGLSRNTEGQMTTSQNRPATCKQLRAALRKTGEFGTDIDVYRDTKAGQLVFSGSDTLAWMETGSSTPRVSDLTFEQWITVARLRARDRS